MMAPARIDAGKAAAGAMLALERTPRLHRRLLGTHEHLAVDLHASLDPETRGLRLRSGEQRFYERRVGFRFPMALSGYAAVHEWYDEPNERFQIDVTVTNPRWGWLFGYRGSFEVERVPCDPDSIPNDMKPVREEARE